MYETKNHKIIYKKIYKNGFFGRFKFELRYDLHNLKKY